MIKIIGEDKASLKAETSFQLVVRNDPPAVNKTIPAQKIILGD